MLLSSFFLLTWKSDSFIVEKSVHSRSFSGPNAGKYGPEERKIQTFFTQCFLAELPKLIEIVFLLIN